MAATMYLQSRLRRQLIGLNPRISIYCDLINTKILFPDYEVLEPNIVGSWKSALGSFFYIWVNPVLIATPGTQIWLVQAFYILIQVLKRQTPCKNSSYSEKKNAGAFILTNTMGDKTVLTSTFKFYCQINFILCLRPTSISSANTSIVTYRLSYLLVFIVLNPSE